MKRRPKIKSPRAPKLPKLIKVEPCEHIFGDEPYCDLCGEPHGPYFEQLKKIVGM